MKKIGLPNNHNPSRWRKALLAAGLLLVAVAGVLHLPEVQAIFFPGRYHTIELNLIRHECAMVDKGLVVLRADMAKLQVFCPSAALSPRSAAPTRPDAEPAWATTLHKAKKDRVYVARKLKYIDIMLKSMHQAIEHQRSSQAAALAGSNSELEKTLAQIQEIRARCALSSGELQKISEKLNQLAGCSVRQ